MFSKTSMVDGLFDSVGHVDTYFGPNLSDMCSLSDVWQTSDISYVEPATQPLAVVAIIWHRGEFSKVCLVRACY